MRGVARRLLRAIVRDGVGKMDGILGRLNPTIHTAVGLVIRVSPLEFSCLERRRRKTFWYVLTPFSKSRDRNA